MLFSIVELHFGSMITHLISRMWGKLLIMMFPMHQILMMIEFTHAVGSSNWKSGKFVIIVVRTSYSPTDDSYSSLKHLSVIPVTKIVPLQQILFYTKNVFICVCLYFLSHLSFHLYYSFLFMYAYHWISWRSRNSNFFNLEFRNCFVMLFCNSYDVIPLFILSSICNSSKHFKYMFDYCVR